MTPRPLDLSRGHFQASPELLDDPGMHLSRLVWQLARDTVNGSAHVGEGPIRCTRGSFHRVDREEMCDGDGQTVQSPAQFEL